MLPAEEVPRLPPEIAEQLPELRKQYGTTLLYVPACGGILLRPFSRGELIQYELNLASSPIRAQATLFRDHMVWPRDWQSFADGVSLSEFQALFSALWTASGFRDPETLEADLNQMRLFVHERDHMIIGFICRAFQSLSPLDFDRYSRDEILYLLAQAELVTGSTWDGRDLTDLVQQLSAEAERAAIKAGRAPQRQRFFDWERDYRESRTADDDVSAVNKPIERQGRGGQGRVP